MTKKSGSGKQGLVRRFFSLLGPGFITGAADDDPSGIATYSITGAQMGTAMLWTAFITWPFMACVQFMCARIGMVTGLGLGDALRRKGPRWLMLFGAVGLLAAPTRLMWTPIFWEWRTPQKCLAELTRTSMS
jgi:Mn2+/Fe2+ NRAMP family transporter